MAIRYEQILEATDFVFSKIGEQPEIAIILGTGLGGVAERITPKEIVPYDEIPNFKVPTVKEHLGRLIFGTLANKSVIAMQGRFHYYEG
ncbi:MAG: purine-nucleoside phosphorylase, partial [Syntrophaceae bacterium]|nr:purine-nucleoside phosphorylase [Syntrophaceae bacterium]